MPTIGFVTGSLSWQLDQLEVGECVLMPDTEYTLKTGSRAPRLEITKRRVRAHTGKDFTVRSCVGHGHEWGSPTFRFYQITRIK